MEHTILIVDDEINTLKVLAAALKNRNIHVETARSGEEALELLKKKKYSLVISDFKMGGISGEKIGKNKDCVSGFTLHPAHRPRNYRAGR